MRVDAVELLLEQTARQSYSAVGEFLHGFLA